MIKQGDKTRQRNHIFLKRVESFEELLDVLSRREQIFVRHKIYASAFIKNWTLSMLDIQIRYGHIWQVEKIDKEEIARSRMREALNSN